MPAHDESDIVLTIDADYLRQVATAICEVGSQLQVTLRIKDPESMIAVIGNTGAGVIMPCTANKDANQFEVRNTLKQFGVTAAAMETSE